MNTKKRLLISISIIAVVIAFIAILFVSFFSPLFGSDVSAAELNVSEIGAINAAEEGSSDTVYFIPKDTNFTNSFTKWINVFSPGSSASNGGGRYYRPSCAPFLSSGYSYPFYGFGYKFDTAGGRTNQYLLYISFDNSTRTFTTDYIDSNIGLATFQSDCYFSDSKLYQYYSECGADVRVLSVGNTPNSLDNPKTLYYIPEGVFNLSRSSCIDLLSSLSTDYYFFTLSDYINIGTSTSDCSNFAIYYDSNSSFVFRYFYFYLNQGTWYHYLYFSNSTNTSSSIPITVKSGFYTEDINLYNLFVANGCNASVVFVDGRNFSDEDLANAFSTGYASGYTSGYNTGYSEGANKAYSDQIISNPLSLFLQPVSDFMNLKLFGTISLAMVFNIVLFVFVAAIFIKMFAGG